MKNLFNYATKELSQDAFIMWLLDNYNCEDEDLKNASRKFIQIATGIPNDKFLSEVWIKPQWYKIDITAFFTTQEGDKTALFIEDKTTSSEHNQLLNYNRSIEKIKAGEKGRINKVVKLYYKTGFLDEAEKKRIIDASWHILPFEEIHDLWKEYASSSNQILAQYSQHIQTLWEECNNRAKPNNDNINAWFSFFKNTVIPQITAKCTCWSGSTRYKYSSLWVRPEGKGEGTPYLEIRSRDCKDNKFTARILMSKQKDIPFEKELHLLRNEVKKRESAGLFVAYESEKNTALVGKTKENLRGAATNEEFIELCNDSIEEFLQIMQKLPSRAE